jgi:hypothetical protein
VTPSARVAVARGEIGIILPPVLVECERVSALEGNQRHGHRA